MTLNSTGNTSVYFDGSLVSCDSYSAGVASSGNRTFTTMFGHPTNGYELKMFLDEVYFFNESLNSTEISELYNGAYYPFTTNVSSNINVTLNYPANYSQTNGTNVNFSCSATENTPGFALTNITFFLYNSSGGLLFNYTTNITGMSNSSNLSYNFGSNQNLTWNCQAYSNGSNSAWALANYTFFRQTSYPMINYFSLSDNLTTWTNQLNYSLTLSGQYLNIVQINDSCGNGFINNSINNNTYYLNRTNLDITNCSLGQKSIWLYKCNSPNGTALNCNNNSFTWYNRARLNITAISALTNLTISNFSVYVNGSFVGNTTTGIYLLDGLENETYNITLSAMTFATTSQEVIITNLTYNTLNMSLFTTNSINILIRDENTGAFIYNNISIRFSSNYTEFTNTTNTSTFYIDYLNDTVYTILFTSAGYSNRTYIVTVGNQTSQTLNVYLVNSSSTTIFTVSDQDTSELLSDVLSTMYKNINGSWQPVESKYSDITGKIQFSYYPTTKYKFYLSKSGYQDNVFYLDPVLFNSYDVKLTKSVLINYSVDFDDLAIIYAPSLFSNNNITPFNWIIASPSGLLTEYGISLTYPGGNGSITGNNAIGGQLNLTINITGAGAFDTVRLEYYYITSLSGKRNFTILLPIDFTNSINKTFMSNKDNTYGLGIFERLLIITILIILIVGLASMAGQPLPGLVLGLLTYGYSVYIGFIPLWAILPSMFIGVIFITWKSGG